MGRHEVWAIDEKDEFRRSDFHLRHVIDPESFSGEHGRMVFLNASFNKLIERACGNALGAIAVDLVKQGKNLLGVAALEGG